MVSFRKFSGCLGLAVSLALFALTSCKKPSGPRLLQPVRVITLRPQPVNVETILPGRVYATEIAHIRPQVSGVITSRDFQQGADVKKGQSLYRIYEKPYRAAVESAKGALLSAQAQSIRADVQLKRYGPLRKAHAVSRQEYDNALATARQARGQVYTARGQLTQAEVNLEYSHVLSPIEGRIGRMIVTPGTLVTAGQQSDIAIVTRLDPIYVDVPMAADDMLRFRAEMAKGRLKKVGNMEAAVALELPNGQPYSRAGKLKLAEVTVDPGTGTFIMRAIFPNPDHLLLPGMFVRGRVEEGMDPAALLVPQGAVLRNPKGDPYLLGVEGEGRVVMIPVTLGAAMNGKWVVASGAEPGMKIIVSGLQKVVPGQKVQIMPGNEEGGAAKAAAGANVKNG